MVPDIGDVEKHILPQLPLYAEKVVLNVAVSCVLRNPGNVVRRWIEGRHQRRRIALVGSSVAAWSRLADCDDIWRQRIAVVRRVRGNLRHTGELRLRGVDRQD